MPSAGLTKIQAVNRLLRAVNEGPVTALDTGGPSIVARAEEVLDDARIAYLTRGWKQENVQRCARLTPSGNPATVSLTSSALRVRGAGPHEHRSFQIRTQKLFDLDNYTNEFNTTVDPTVYVDIAHNVEWDDLSPGMKEAITDEAAVHMQRDYRGSPERDAGLQQRLAKTESLIRPWSEQMPPPQLNNVPIVLQPQQRQQQ